tara:strand:- start:4539 stop:5156 length:618 start_codon:yes stop_codon:yes gene_type:complete
MSIVKLNNRGVKNVTSFGSASSGAMTFIKKLTASSSATLSFVDGTSDVVLDNTYKEYLFTFNNMHPATDGTNLRFQASTDGGSNYNTTMTTTTFRAFNSESGSEAVLQYTNLDQGQGTDFQRLTYGQIGADNDQCASGYIHLFNPSDTTFVKHYISVASELNLNNYAQNGFGAGYFNTTSAINAIQFKMSTGNIDAGDICLYGIN